MLLWSTAEDMIGMNFQSEGGSVVEGAGHSGGSPELLIVPHLRAHRAASGNLVSTQKFLEGTAEYAAHWPGKVTVAVVVEPEPDNNLDHREVRPGDWDFEVVEQPTDASKLVERMREAALVLLSPSLSHLAIEHGLPYVLVTENTLRTRCQMVMTTTRQVFRRVKRLLWEMLGEWRIRKGVAAAAGVQCNGFPTYEAYRRLNASSLLFFDTRVTSDDVIDPDVLNNRLLRMAENGPLRLLFSGRLIGIKGVDHLPQIADELRKRSVPFTMEICGGGDRAASIAERVKELGLSDCVTLRGVLDFSSALLPLVRESTDVFVCPHLQGDPSCTYLETMACGVPIVGYANEAWEPLAKLSEGGWQTPMKDPKALAARIAQLHQQREQIATASLAARAFAVQHTFEVTFQRRVEHLIKAAKLPEPVAVR